MQRSELLKNQENFYKKTGYNPLEKMRNSL
jgi:hypothetical protein